MWFDEQPNPRFYTQVELSSKLSWQNLRCDHPGLSCLSLLVIQAL
jgi:hypothetical protein